MIIGIYYNKKHILESKIWLLTDDLNEYAYDRNYRSYNCIHVASYNNLNEWISSSSYVNGRFIEVRIDAEVPIRWKELIELLRQHIPELFF
jgi:hypothetical protein